MPPEMTRKTMSARILPWRKLASALALTALFSLSGGPTLADSNVLFTGGGIVVDGKGVDAKRISFSVNLFAESGGMSMGHLQFHFR